MNDRCQHLIDERNVPSSSCTVLLAEDDGALRNVLSKYLTRMGARVLAAEDGQEALTLFRKYTTAIDLAILDLEMPNVCGGEAFEEMRRAQSSIPVIITSGDNQDCIMKRFRRNPPSDIIQKPIRPDALRDAVQRCIAYQQQRETCNPDHRDGEEAKTL